LESVTFYQTYKGVPVYGGEIVVSLDREWIFATVGGILTSKVDLDVTPAISDRDAEAIARAETGMPDAPIMGVTRLIVFDYSLIEDVAPDPRLTWIVRFGGGKPTETIVDAHSGAMLSSHSTVFDAYELMLMDENGATTSDCFNDTDDDLWIGSEMFLFFSHISDPDAVMAWNFSKDVYDFFTAFNLDSYDNNGAEAKVHIHADVKAGAWSEQCGLILFNDGWVGGDVMVHEYGHAVISYSSKLGSTGQPRSLNESFADGMAMMADPDEWLMADTTTGNMGPIRDLSNMSIKHMDAYADDANVYDNLGIPDTAIFLLSDGGTLNDLTITGIGRIKMAWLNFAALRSLGSGAKFIDARNHIVATAEEWAQDGYAGFTDNDLCQVRNAYYAVGLGDPDLDCDGTEDPVNPDPDNDSISNPLDNCPDKWNPGQEDFDNDGIGDFCDPDFDGDGVPEAGSGWNWQLDNCPGVYNPGQEDSDLDGIGYACDDDEDSDNDNDGVKNWDDNCPLDYNPKEGPRGSGNFIQPDADKDGEGDVCDPDSDKDGFSNDNDNCPFTANSDQTDTDQDGAGDVCDKCPETEDVIAWTTGNPDLGIDPQPYQPDSDKNGIPDACDGGMILGGIPWGQAFEDITMNGAEYNGAAIGNPTTSLLLPIPVCPPDQGSGFSQDYRELLLLHGLDSSVSARLVDGTGNVASQPRINGSRYLSFAPRGGEPYYLRLGFGPQYQAGQVTSFTLSVSCGPKDLLPPPPVRQALDGAEPPDEVGQTLEIVDSAKPTLTPIPTPTFTPTPQPQACTVTALVSLFCRPAPGYEPIDEFRAGQSAAVVAQSEFLWQVLGLNSGLLCTVPKDAAFVRTDGDCNNVPYFTPLPRPTPTLEPVLGCTVRQAGGAIICVSPCPTGASPGEACTP
jgi:Zn-dependent metalloprotease